MAENKTQKTGSSVTDFVAGIEDPQKRADAEVLVNMMREITGQEPKMWGSSIVGFGDLHYKSKSGREGDWFKVGFSPRKQNLTLYLALTLDRFEPVLGRLGKHSTGKGCVYIKRLDQVDHQVLEELIQRAYSTS